LRLGQLPPNPRMQPMGRKRPELRLGAASPEDAANVGLCGRRHESPQLICKSLGRTSKRNRPLEEARWWPACEREGRVAIGGEARQAFEGIEGTRCDEKTGTGEV
jgi:hypothetical protein